MGRSIRNAKGDSAGSGKIAKNLAISQSVAALGHKLPVLHGHIARLLLHPLLVGVGVSPAIHTRSVSS